MSETVIRVDSLVKKYGNFTAVNGISFEIRRGEILAFLGPNGAGKTTTVETLECLKTPTSGLVNILGYDVRKDERKIKGRIGVLPQSFSTYDWLTVRENLLYFGKMYPQHADVDKLIELFGLKEKRDSLFRSLSGGLKQRVGIAISLINDPEIVFLDEPTTGLDPKARRDVWAAIKELKSHGKTVLLTTHYMDEAYALADRICVIHKGKIIAEGTPEDLINQYGGGNTLIIRECTPQALERLSQNLPGSRISGNDLQVSLPEGNGTGAISRAVAAIGGDQLSCKEIYVKKASLEDVFLNLTGEVLTEGAQ
ncbi:MAG TPA: ABC transporter ATP-binding protein [Methanocella sp.]|nr:ABC transporter ATP-binding protein [Methanocella sp.]